MIHMVLADREEEYVRRLTQWFAENKPCQFRISSFTEEDSFNRFLQSGEAEADVFLIEEYFLTKALSGKENLILLGGGSVSEIPSVGKYQPASSLCAAILSHMSEWHKEMPKWGNTGKSDIIICFSPDQPLKSTLALHLTMASEDNLYMNLESFPYFTLQAAPHCSRGLSDILYHIKASKGNLTIALESAVCNTEQGMNFIRPMDNPRDLWELTGRETEIFGQSLISWGRFSEIILDVEFNTGPSMISWFDFASRIIVPYTAVHSRQIIRVKSMLESLPNMKPDKLRFVLAGQGSEPFLQSDADHFYSLPWLEAFPESSTDFCPSGSVAEQLRTLLS